MIKSKKQMLVIIGVFALVMMLGTVTYAFFHYTRTGPANTIATGRIYFSSTQDGIINLTNVFPISSTNLETDVENHGTVTINIEGDTTYSNGIEYKVTLENVNNSINGKEVPITVEVSVDDLGTASSDYYNARGSTTAVYKVNSYGDAYNGQYVAVGYIPAGSTGVDGSIDITVYIDTNKVAISDTYNELETDLMGTTNDWVMGRS